MAKRHTATWKAVEKRVAALLGGTRISGPRGVEMEDVAHEHFSVEVKHGKSVPKFVESAYLQAARNAPPGKRPLVVLHRHQSREYVAVLGLEDLAELVQLALACSEGGDD